MTLLYIIVVNTVQCRQYSFLVCRPVQICKQAKLCWINGVHGQYYSTSSSASYIPRPWDTAKHARAVVETGQHPGYGRSIAVVPLKHVDMSRYDPAMTIACHWHTRSNSNSNSNRRGGRLRQKGVGLAVPVKVQAVRAKAGRTTQLGEV